MSYERIRVFDSAAPHPDRVAFYLPGSSTVLLLERLYRLPRGALAGESVGTGGEGEEAKAGTSTAQASKT